MIYSEYRTELKVIRRTLSLHFINKALEKSDWCVAAAARSVEMDRRNFCRLMKKFGVVRPAKEVANATRP